MRTSVKILLCFPVMASMFCHAAGVQIGRTRIIYDAAKKEVSLPLQNNEKELPWLIQSWTDTGDGKTRGPFIVTPPLFRLDAQKEQSLRITWNGTPLPTDKETLFYLNVRTVPATSADDEDKNVLRLIYKTRLKLFWRPTGLVARRQKPVNACASSAARVSSPSLTTARFTACLTRCPLGQRK